MNTIPWIYMAVVVVTMAALIIEVGRFRRLVKSRAIWTLGSVAMLTIISALVPVGVTVLYLIVCKNARLQQG